MSKIYKELIQLNNKKNPIFKRGTRTKYTFLQRRHLSPEVYKKELSITNHQRNSNQNNNGISHKTFKNGDHQDLQVISDGEAVEKRKPPTLLVGM